ncbi:phospho-acceptor domain-containing protein [Actinoplanes teichomyceticus]|uniref:histidine kinase n=1 Tax=Actinoplanes teichomyceticus TaxID=1867 RepID=A0A561VI59_ACTTI|nr:phospho-acceptor domain-containing protein [Actinoplanes teichomyceticus]
MTARVGRAPLVAAAAIPLAVVVVHLLAGRQLGQVPAFMPGFLAVVWVLDLLTAFLLFTQYTAGGSPRLLVLAAAYLWSSTVIVPHALVFSGLFSPAGLLGAVPSSAPWLWTAWHVGLPLLIGAAMAPWHPRWHTRAKALTARGRLGAVAVAVTLVLTAAVSVTWLVTAGHDHIPVIIVNGDYTVLTQRFGPAIIGINVLALVLGATRFRRDTVRGLEAWAFVAVAASCGDVVLTLFSRARFTVGWYGARVLALVAALVVLSALLREVTVLYRRVRATAVELAQRNGELQTADALRDHLMAVVSHELRTPLTGLTGIVEILRDGRDRMPPAKVDDMLARADALTHRLTMLTEDLLAVSTLGHGELHVAPTTVDLAEALGECARMFGRTDVRLDCPEELYVAADPLRLQQMLANYVRNAIKYGAEPIVLSATAAAEGVQVRVRDHGTGVPPEFVPELFDRFTRAEQAKAGPVAGSGLGLSIVATLAAAHGGRVWYEPAEPGACFGLTLPASAVPASAPAGAVPVAPVAGAVPVAPVAGAVPAAPVAGAVPAAPVAGAVPAAEAMPQLSDAAARSR